MAQRILYIIKSLHLDEIISLDRRQEINECYEVTLPLIQYIIQQTQCTAYFSGSTTEEGAEIINIVIQKLARTPSEDQPLFIEQLSEELKDEKDVRYIIVNFANLWRRGIQVKYMPTEKTLDELEILQELYETGQISDEQYKRGMKLAEDFGDPLYLQMPGGTFSKPILTFRDRKVFENVVAFGEEVNVLFMGEAHLLIDFEQEEHDFRIYQTNIFYDNGVKLEGALPIQFKPFIDDLARELCFDANINYDKNSQTN